MSTPLAATEEALADAAGAGLRWVCDGEAGIRRRRAGRGFAYRLGDGTPVRDAETLARIRALAIPPAWRDVWICRSARGHLQATGRDARGRKQYRYHPRWREVRDENKFCRLVAFADALPKLRRRLRADLARPGWPREKVLALVVALMAQTLCRIGNDEYARSNRSFGLTTLRNRHVAFERDSLRLRFRGKAGKEHDLRVEDARLARLVRACQELPGQALFQYLDENGDVQPVDSADVNAWLQAVCGEDFTAKDFRTWGGTVLAFRRLAMTPLPAPGRDGRIAASALAAAQKQVVAEVAAALGNTVAVCRRAYIDPAVFAGWEDGRLQAAAARCRGERQWEQAARRFLAKARRLSAKAARP